MSRWHRFLRSVRAARPLLLSLNDRAAQLSELRRLPPSEQAKKHITDATSAEEKSIILQARKKTGISPKTAPFVKSDVGKSVAAGLAIGVPAVIGVAALRGRKDKIALKNGLDKPNVEQSTSATLPEYRQKITKQYQKDSLKADKLLTPDEKKAVKEHVVNSRPLNEYLQNPQRLSDGQKRQFNRQQNLLNSALKKTKTDVPMVLYHGTGSDKFFGKNKIKVGDARDTTSFLSTSSDIMSAARFATKQRNGVVLIINVPAGMNLLPTGNSKQMEYILGKGVPLKIKSVHRASADRNSPFRKDTTIVELDAQ